MTKDKRNKAMAEIQQLMHYHGIEEFLSIVSEAMADAADETESCLSDKTVSANYRFRRGQLDEALSVVATRQELQEYIDDIDSLNQTLNTEGNQS